jgi:long-chain-fatty-acid--[acyl-carrier-protein] ligase
MFVLRFLMYLLFRFFVWARYRVRVHGLDSVRRLSGPLLLLPNHPGLCDPCIVLTSLWRTLRPRPMLYEGNFRGLFYPVMPLLNAVRVPDLDQLSRTAHERAREAVAGVVDGLRQGDNILLWPAGRTEVDGTERLGGARALADVLEQAPESQIVLVRTRGVFGSMFSWAYTGKHPHLGRRILAALGWLAASLFVFMPRRRVDVYLEPIARSELPELRREALNPWFEARYNRDGPETPTYFPYHFLFSRRTYQFPPISETAELDQTKITPEVREAVGHIIEEKLGRQLTEQEQKAETTFDQMGLDSLDRMEMTLRVEQRFGFSGDTVPTTLGEMWALAQGLAKRTPAKPPPQEWFRPLSNLGPLTIDGETVAAAFVAKALANRRDVIVADDLAGVLTYEKLLVGALTFARRFAELPEANVGLLLPASAAADIVFLGLHLAGKLPVVLNWTTGPAYLAQASRLVGLSHVVTSKAFLDRSGVTIEGAEFIYVEDLRKNIGKWEQIRMLLRVRWRPQRVRAGVTPWVPSQPAVILFTSGSEKAPKAVPLTHENLIANMRSYIEFFSLTRQDSILGFLPAFHSFGMSVTGLMPLLGALRVVRHPDPTDAAGLARKVAGYKPTLMAGTPTFVSFILDRSEPGGLSSLRLAIVGAEKCPDALGQRWATMGMRGELLEGYGITECAPVVSANPPGCNKPGTLGVPLPRIEVCVVNLEVAERAVQAAEANHQQGSGSRAVPLEAAAVLPPGELGMLLVHGPNVFPGYIGYDGPSPFVELSGKRWYVTGDLASIDTDGYIHFGGRLKRFLKAGGEMISLPALEEPLTQLYPPTKDGPRIAVEGVEHEGTRQIVLFTTEAIKLNEANRVLEEHGFRGVMRLTDVRRLEQIPVLGASKINYKALRAMLTETNAV